MKKAWSHPKRVQLSVYCHTSEEVARVYETFGRMAAGFTIDNLEASLSGETMWCTDPECDGEETIRSEAGEEQ